MPEQPFPCTADPELFFPGRNDVQKLRQAQQVCGGCPARVACYEQAVKNKETDGVWGGYKFGDAVVPVNKGIRSVPLGPDGWPIGIDRSRFLAAACGSGHKWTPKTTGWYEHHGAIARYCKPCRRDRKSEARAKKQAARSLLAA